MFDYEDFCDSLELRLNNCLLDNGIEPNDVDVRVHGKTITALIYITANSKKLVFKEGVLAVYDYDAQNSSWKLKDVCFECEHVFTDPIGATAIFFLNYCELLQSKESGGVEVDG